MTENEAYLIARMQVALVSEGILHSIPLTGPVEKIAALRVADGLLIRQAVMIAWERLTESERRVVRYWRLKA